MSRPLSPRQVRALFEARVRRTLGISGREFLDRWDAGIYDPLDCTQRQIMRLAMLLPFVRPS